MHGRNQDNPAPSHLSNRGITRVGEKHLTVCSRLVQLEWS
ncbi:hypothetical protein KsCSTR_37880 [Candidatus Kuenenia stuttgartiensis]|uniref:Uncharacterized protein n=1 Tax=Kuenenia stuttgartiensis TaxID=174633 RepID=A0A6G7GVC5_KUEST|nr:hypothetical protein KsCSTR_37880 [Candidatus Kuenenia stuttgartiensis]